MPEQDALGELDALLVRELALQLGGHLRARGRRPGALGCRVEQLLVAQLDREAVGEHRVGSLGVHAQEAIAGGVELGGERLAVAVGQPAQQRLAIDQVPAGGGCVGLERPRQLRGGVP